jgi:hypothetical protein
MSEYREDTSPKSSKGEDTMIATPVDNSALSPSAYSAPQHDAALTAAAVDQTQSFDVTLMTEEGDKVTLAYNSQAQTALVAYNERGTTAGQSFKRPAHLTKVAFSQALTLTVEGDLNREEQQDIHKALRRIGQMVKAFLHGKMEKVARQAGKLHQLDTVDHIQASYGLTYSATAIVAASETRLSDPFQTTASDQHAHDHHVGDATELEIEEIDALTDEMARILRQSDREPEMLKQHSSRLFKQILDDLEPAHWWRQRAVALLEMIRERLGTRLEKNGPAWAKPPVKEEDYAVWV